MLSAVSAVNENGKKRKKLGPGKIALIVVAVILALYAISMSVTQLILRDYISELGSAEYDEDRLVPEVGEEGYYTFTSDGDIKIMQLNDVHIGGGIFSITKDKKTIYEVMTMVQKEKPDLVVLNGDNVFAVPSIAYNGGGTFNNKMASKNILYMFETLQTYFTVSFGNHDTEVFDFCSRADLGKLYMSDKYKYCIFNQDYDGYGVTNQCILLKNTAGEITKAILVLDSNAYIDDSIKSCLDWKYDTIHDDQVEWAKSVIEDLSEKNGQAIKTICFFHIPIGEFATAYRDLEANAFEDTATTQYIGGVWDEEIDEEMGERIWYGGCYRTDEEPEDVDSLFETLGPDGINTLEGIFVGHDHVNNAVVNYRGVILGYGNAVDNLAYEDIAESGLQRGCIVINVSSDGSWTQVHKNVYKDYGADTDKFIKVNLDEWYYPGIEVPKN